MNIMNDISLNPDYLLRCAHVLEDDKLRPNLGRLFIQDENCVRHYVAVNKYTILECREPIAANQINDRFLIDTNLNQVKEIVKNRQNKKDRLPLKILKLGPSRTNPINPDINLISGKIDLNGTILRLTNETFPNYRAVIRPDDQIQNLPAYKFTEKSELSWADYCQITKKYKIPFSDVKIIDDTYSETLVYTSDNVRLFNMINRDYVATTIYDPVFIAETGTWRVYLAYRTSPEYKANYDLRTLKSAQRFYDKTVAEKEKWEQGRAKLATQLGK